MQHFPDAHAATTPERPAIIMAGSGITVTYRQLTDRSRRAARVMRAAGAGHGDCVALFMENGPTFLELAWAAQRAGLRYTTIPLRSTPDEVAYILRDSDSKIIFASLVSSEVAIKAADQAGVLVRISIDTGVAGLDDLGVLMDEHPAELLQDEAEGVDFLYSSGTTGRPKAISAPIPLSPLGTPPGLVGLLENLYGFGRETIFLSPAPLYHSGPLRFNMAIQRLGGTCVVMERFDAAQFLEVVQRLGVTHTQVVPTMFVRMLRLPEEERARWDTSSLRALVHAAAPCPPDVKQQMIEWLGPVVHEYYSATEVHLFTAIDSEDWLAHRGSVGRALLGTPHILDEDGHELPPGEPGTIFSEGGNEFEYHNDPDKTRESRNADGWTTVGDIGYLDADGYLYLTDRKSDMIISGGVNVYPQEAENILVSHPAVADAAVFGIPHDELGEVPHGAVLLVPTDRAPDDVVTELLELCSQKLARQKCPRAIDVVDELPRSPTGKLYKRLLRQQYANRANA